MQIEVRCVCKVESELMRKLFWNRTKSDRAHCRRTGACLRCVLQQLARTAKAACLLASMLPLAQAGFACCDAKRVFLAVFVVLQHRNRIVKDKRTVTKELRTTRQIPLREVVERLERRRLVDVY